MNVYHWPKTDCGIYTKVCVGSKISIPFHRKSTVMRNNKTICSCYMTPPLSRVLASLHDPPSPGYLPRYMTPPSPGYLPRYMTPPLLGTYLVT